jgi:hypothetical protein
MKTFRVQLLLCLLLIVPAALLAQHPLSGDVQVNVNSVDPQLFPHLATNPSGEFVVTWVGAHAHDDGYSLYAVRFTANGTPATGEIVVSDHALNVAGNSAAAMMDDGSFVVIFPKADGAAQALTARWYTPGGSAEGTDVLVSRNWSPGISVSTQGDGGFVVAWQGSTPSAWARVFAPDHAAGSAEILVDASGLHPVVAVGPQGGFVVAWQSGQIVARRFTPQGVAAGRRLIVDSSVNGAGPGAAGSLHIGKDDDGGFIIFWGAGSTVFARRYQGDTTPIGGLLRMQAAAGYDAAVGGKGNFVLAWEAPDTGAQGTNVFTRRFKADGSPLGPQIRANVHTKGSQKLPQVGIGADGGFIVVWQSVENDSSDIFARRFERK